MARRQQLIEVRVGRDYFGPAIPCSDELTAISLINLVPSLHVRVELGGHRFLLTPEKDGIRFVEGWTDLYILYSLFNDVSRHSYSAIGLHGHERIYINTSSSKCNQTHY